MFCSFFKITGGPSRSSNEVFSMTRLKEASESSVKINKKSYALLTNLMNISAIRKGLSILKKSLYPLTKSPILVSDTTNC